MLILTLLKLKVSPPAVAVLFGGGSSEGVVMELLRGSLAR
jgi:hypothetical protein